MKDAHAHQVGLRCLQYTEAISSLPLKPPHQHAVPAGAHKQQKMHSRCRVNKTTTVSPENSEHLLNVVLHAGLAL
jgi:hypothetical protein